ncbi:hypothetical protein [Ureibacillus acetophenoni]|uniref:Uncharacterized protein n=1 Tax=Ureibacillus acetophenoni TaxID=614649 RepID=A0A285U970_9BACL|nr:hypothetical protein [Ureibacillus acetophenoni]SOC37086.1 hypothetical protein SAMN05877842_10317 [Ureibacillus acetophenoni]
MLNGNILPLLLSSRNNDKEIFSIAEKFKISENELHQYLGENQIEKFLNREMLLWRLYHSFENLVLEYPNHTNGDLAELLVDIWNEKESVKISKNNAKHFIESISLQLDSRKRAFISLCEHDIESCLIYLRKDSVPFVEWLVRFGILISKKDEDLRELDIIEISKVILGQYFPHVNPKDEMFKCFDQLGFCHKIEGSNRKKFDFKRIKKYKLNNEVESLPFAKGLATLIFNAIENQVEEPFVKYKVVLTNLFHGKGEIEYENITPENPREKIAHIAIDATSKPIDFFGNEDDGASFIDEVTEQFVNAKMIEKEKLNFDIEKIENVYPEHSNEDSAKIDPTILVNEKSNGWFSILNDFDGLHIKIKEIIKDNENAKIKISQLEKENVHLSYQLEEYEKNKKENSYEQLIQFIKLVGGREGNYALHNLYQDSFHPIDNDSLQLQGSLISLFTILGLKGIEPYLGSYQLGEEVNVKKSKIGQLFTVKDAIQSAEEDVDIKIIGYGWTLDGKILVQPIVEEINK